MLPRPEAAPAGDSRWEEPLAEMQQYLLAGELVGGIAHEINNPLTSLMTHLSLALRAWGEPGAAAGGQDLGRRLETMSRDAERIARLNEHILKLARPRSHAREMVNLRGLLEETVEVLAYELRTRRLRAELMEGPARAVEGDPAELRQAIINVVRHVVGLCPEAATLTIGTSDEEGVAAVWVSAMVECEAAEHTSGRAPAGEDEPPEMARRRLGLRVARDIAEARGGSLVVARGGDGEVRVTLALGASRAPEPG